MKLATSLRHCGKDRLFAFISFIAGLIFVLGIILHATSYSKMSWAYPLEQLGKITCQSNLLAFFTAGLYFFKPNHRFFKSNFLLLFSAVLLCFAGIGFWCLLFPLYYIDLGSLIMSSDEPKTGASIFYVIWDHSVTQWLFFLFFQRVNRRKDLDFLIPISTRKIILRMFVYTISWVTYNIMVSFIFKIFPTYGILTNFNPRTNFISQDTNVMLFNVRFLIISHIMCCFFACVLAWYFSLLATRLRAINAHSILKKAEFLKTGYR